MFEKSKLKKALSRADKILGERSKLLKVISKEVAELDPLIAARLLGDEEAAAAAADVALETIPVGTRDHNAEGAMWRERIERQSLKLRGLRSRLNQQAGELAAAHQELAESLPAYEADIRQALQADWTAAISTFEILLGRRATLEKFTGKLDLAPVPQRAAAADLGEAMFLPHETLNRLNDGISEITGWAALPQNVFRRDPTMEAPAAFDPKEIYELVRPFENFAAQSRVVACSFPDGILQMLVRDSDAVPVRVDSSAILAAQQAKQKIDSNASDASLRLTEANNPYPGSPLSAEDIKKSKEAQAINEREAAGSTPTLANTYRLYTN